MSQMKSWIFQANPTTFDADAFLDGRPSIFTWLVTRYGKEINEGDHVYLWRAAARDNSKAGIIADAVITSPVKSMVADPYTSQFWRKQDYSLESRERIWLRLVRCGSAKEILKRDWLLEDPVVNTMLILKQATGTNFPLSEGEAHRLEQMWARVGQDWSRSESVAGLWAYASTIGKPVSRLSGSPISVVSRLTGRAVAGVYNKVMNFRSIDPRDGRAGMSGAGETDREVWSEFFDADVQRIRQQALDDEFMRLWGDSSAPQQNKADATSLNIATEREADKLSDKPLPELLDAYTKQESLGSRQRKPQARSASTVVFERNTLVIAIAKSRAGFRCEVVGCAHPLFVGKNRKPYCEVHHIVPLSEGGQDTIDNVACVCPAHHREAHLGQQAHELREMLATLRRSEEGTKSFFCITDGRP
jgi:predicted HNH restriction endonuclease